MTAPATAAPPRRRRREPTCCDGGSARKGRRAALGFAEALSRGAQRVVTLDGDGQHDPDDIPRLLSASAADSRALVIGSRLADGGAGMEPARLNALRVATFFINWQTGWDVGDSNPDSECIRARSSRRCSSGGGFVLETEMLVRAAAAGFPILEVPLSPGRDASRPSRFSPCATVPRSRPISRSAASALGAGCR